MAACYGGGARKKQGVRRVPLPEHQSCPERAGLPWVPGYPPASNTGTALPTIVTEELARRPELVARLKAVKGEAATTQTRATAQSREGTGGRAPDGRQHENTHVAQLLRWHAHNRGGVSVPFRDRGRPLGETVETTLYANLRRAAETIRAAERGPRWIFLVGGPGNGKSQMVEEFGRFLDDTLPGAGLIGELEKAFATDPVPRRVDVPIQPSNGGEWEIRHLTIVQDASSSDRPDGNAAALLVEDLERLLANDDPTGTVFVCSANRGLLARAVRAAGESSTAGHLLREVFRWTGMNEEALNDPGRTTWPLAVDGIPDGLVAAWPLDVESLLAGPGSGFARLIEEATRPEHWENGACDGCPSRSLCPFFTNAGSLRDQAAKENLLKILRRAELASGQRINFRMAFSMVAELVVGDAGDFSGRATGTACGWVHTRVALASEETKRGITAIAELLWHDYVFALIPLAIIDANELYSDDATTAGASAASDVFGGMERADATRQSRAETPVRELLRDTVARLIDPAPWTPAGADDPLRVAEDTFAQGVRAGLDGWPAAAPPTALQRKLIEHLARADEDAEQRFAALGRAAADRVVVAARISAATVAKRSIGVRLGITNQDELMGAYETVVRSQTQLQILRATLKDLIGNQRFVADALAGFGSVESAGSTAKVRALPMTIGQVLPAPAPSAERATHDLPVVIIELQPPPDPRHRSIPITFGLFKALQLSEAGAVNASLPASVRASLDGLGQFYASRATRDEQALRNWDNDFVIISVGGDEIVRLVLPADSGDVLTPEVP